jgi:hypothetical protein
MYAMHPSAMNPTITTIGLRIRNPFTTAKTDSALHTTKERHGRAVLPKWWRRVRMLRETSGVIKL